MKIMTLSAAINSGHYNPNEYYQSGSIQVGDTTLYDWNRSVGAPFLCQRPSPVAVTWGWLNWKRTWVAQRGITT